MLQKIKSQTFAGTANHSVKKLYRSLGLEGISVEKMYWIKQISGKIGRKEVIDQRYIKQLQGKCKLYNQSFNFSLVYCYWKRKGQAG